MPTNEALHDMEVERVEAERFHNTALAAQLIYRESGYLINPSKFYVDNDEALADMKRLAEAA